LIKAIFIIISLPIFLYNINVLSKKGPGRDFYTKIGETMGSEGLKKARGFWEELRHELKEERTVKDMIPEYKGD